MKKLPAFLGTILLTTTTLGVTALGTQEAHAADLVCTTRITGGTVNRTVRIPSGSRCDIRNATIKGHVVAERTARVTVDKTVVTGGVEGRGAASFAVLRSRVRGNVVSDRSAHSFVRSNVVSGSIVLRDTTARQRVFRNHVGRRIACSGNTGDVTGGYNKTHLGRTGQGKPLRQQTQVRIANKTWARSARGTVTFQGQLRLVNSWGSMQAFGGKRVRIDLRRPGTGWVAWGEAGTDARGVFRKTIRQVPGAEVRVVFPGRARHLKPAYQYAGRITKQTGPALHLARAAMWDRIAQCESGGRWNINTGNGYYGGLQFNLATWRSVRGQDFAAYPHRATRAQQITVANRLYAKRGLQPWACRHRA